jgi:DNA modification methylase
MSRIETIGSATLYLGDAREIMPTLGKVGATVTDPAYGINAARNRKSQKHGWRDYAAPGWDKERTDPELVSMAVSVAEHAIVWGGNYFTDILPPTGKWLSWDKGQTDFSLADFELAWCSFEGAARRIEYPRALAMQDGKEHPTQKPVEVMRWCIDKRPKGCSTILDPFMGSGTTGVAAVKLGRKFIGIEVETIYFDIACRRIEEAGRQSDMFIDYNPRDDFNKSVTACYDAIKERVANGGPGWEPPK